MGHWDKVNKYAGYTAKSLLDEKGVSLLQGHTHRYGISARRYVDGKELMGVENFCLCRLDPYYISKLIWSQEFRLSIIKKGRGGSIFTPYFLLNTSSILEGRNIR